MSDLDAYRRIRKPVPPPGRAIPDRRREVEEERARREVEEERARREVEEELEDLEEKST